MEAMGKGQSQQERTRGEPVLNRSHAAGVRMGMPRKLRSQRSVLLLAAAFATVGLFGDGGRAAAAGVPELPQADQILVSTLPHPETSVRWGRATGIVEAPVDDVMRVIGDYGAYREFMPHFESSKVLAQRGQSALVYMEALIAKGTLKVWAQLKIRPETQGDARIVSAHMTKGNLDHMEARWEVKPLDGGSRSLVTFDILVDPKLPLPSGLVSTENEKASKRTIRALRSRLQRTN